ncbi:MAG: phasin family protein [Burkholderiales bacterium]|nr:phasin family protein [Burkholderiales bacterium]MDE2394579.1 phasin family protein [Burkholderiales bacterium]MDE2455267.1 phasin family protein [Burkholderiales bacterium]
MVKKLERLSEKQSAAGLFDGALAGSVKESAQQIWLAGMGAFSKAQAEGGKVFDALVKEGLNLQRRTQGIAEEKLGEVSGRMSAMAESVSARAGQNWDKLESIFEQRTAKAMGRLGVPTAKDVQALAARVAALEKAVGKPARAKAAAPKAAAPAAKPVARKRAARKSAAA